MATQPIIKQQLEERPQRRGLYLITEDIRQLIEVIDEEFEGELTEEMEKALDGLDMEFAAKVESIVKYSRELMADELKHKTEEVRLAKRRKSIERTIKSLKEYVRNAMSVLEIKKVQAGTFPVRRQNNPVGLEIEDERLIPDEYKDAVIQLPATEVPEELKGKIYSYSYDKDGLKARLLQAEKILQDYADTQGTTIDELPGEEKEIVLKLAGMPLNLYKCATIKRGEHLRW